MSYTPFQAPILAELFGDQEIAGQFSVKAEIEAMLRFEAELARAEATHGVIPAEAGEAIAAAAKDLKPDLAAIGVATARDGLAIPEFVRQLRAAVGRDYGEFCHYGTTSQDVIDTALALRLKPVIERLDARLDNICASLTKLIERFGDRPMTGRTRMQAALPIKVGDRLSNWRDPLMRHRDRLGELAPRLICLQFGGPVGTLDKLGDKAQLVSAALASSLGLALAGRARHTERTTIVEFADWLSVMTGSLGKMGTDVTLMAQNEIGEIGLAGTGGSSAMPHKQNPILAESLVTLARFTAVQAGGMHHAMVHEQERSGAAWSLEWLLLPQLCVAAGAATRNAARLLEAVEWIGSPGGK